MSTKAPNSNVWDVLPVELFSYIFMMAVRGERLRDVPYDELEYGKDPPIAMAISSTCQKWRNIALNTPLIWQYIDMCASSFSLFLLSPTVH